MGVFGMLLLGIFVTIVTAILVTLAVALPIGIAVLMVGGSTFAPTLVFSFLFTMGKSDSLIISIIIFAVSFYVLEKLIAYKKVETAIMFHVAAVAAVIAAFAIKTALSFVSVHVPALILLIIMIGVMIFTLSPIFLSDHQHRKTRYPTLTRIIASVLYGSAISGLVGSLALVFDINLPDYFTAIAYVLWVLSGIAAYILDMKLAENEEIIRIIRELPVRKILKKYYDRYAKYVLNRVAKFVETK